MFCKMFYLVPSFEFKWKHENNKSKKHQLNKIWPSWLVGWGAKKKNPIPGW